MLIRNLKSINRDQFFEQSISTKYLSYYYGFSGVDVKQVCRALDIDNIHGKHQALLDHQEMNKTENRPVTHHACRHPDHRNKFTELKAFCKDVHQNKITINGKNVSSVFHIGVGGSVSGPKMLCHALKSWGVETRLSYRFISNHDEDHICNQLNGIDIKSTLFLVVSKSGSTVEVKKILETVIQRYGLDAEQFYSSQCIAITSEGSLYDTDQFFKRFTFDVGVGGRFSTTSHVGCVPLGLAFGADMIDPFLDAVFSIDKAAMVYDESNVPFVQALINVELRRQRVQGLACVPYGEALLNLPNFITQLICESLGKSVSLDGRETDALNCPIVLQGHGPGAQHTFFQQLHQGINAMLTEFVYFNPTTSSQGHILQQIIGQMVSLAQGKAAADLNHHFEGNRASSLLIIEPSIRGLGALVSTIENRVMFESFILNINAFDQPGVELGKLVTQSISDNNPNDLASSIYQSIRPR